MGGCNQRAQPAQQDQTFDMNRGLVQVVENLAAGVIGGHRVHIAANRLPRRIHARDDGELGVSGERHHDQHEDSLRNDGAVVRPGQDKDREENQPAEEAHPVQAYQRAANNHTGGVNPGGWIGKERRELAERNRSENGAKEYQRSQPDAERKVDQGMKERAQRSGSHAKPEAGQ
jgi:hypothetical protein